MDLKKCTKLHKHVLVPSFSPSKPIILAPLNCLCQVRGRPQISCIVRRHEPFILFVWLWIKYRYWGAVLRVIKAIKKRKKEESEFFFWTEADLDGFNMREMDEARRYCSFIHAERQKHKIPIKYPLITATLNRYFLPDYREIIADECNLIGYMSIPAIEYEPSQKEEAKLDLTKTWWQEKIYQERKRSRQEAEERKKMGLTIKI